MKICDFDLAEASASVVTAPPSPPRAANPCGSAEYVAPEAVEAFSQEAGI